MNSQNILRYFGSKLDVKLDYSEYYDFELFGVDDTTYDYNLSMSLETPIIDTTCISDIPFIVNIGQTYTGDTCNYTVRRRTEKGWTLDFVFNRDNNPWSNGSTFYYWGIQDETNVRYYADNNLSFSFTNDGKVKWEAYRYSGVCDPTSGYTEHFYTSTGETPTLCSGGTSNDFNLTITFERNSYYENCDIENEGSWNDLILGPHAVSYTPTVTASTSTQIATGYTITNDYRDWITGATITYQYLEELSKKWWKDKNKRLGTLKIYLNGNRIYKIKDWEEVIPSNRGSDNTIVQIWGGGTTGSNNLHLGQTWFTLKNMTYYEEPLNFLQVRDNYKNNIKPEFTIVECNEPCNTPLAGQFDNMLLFEDGDKIFTDDENNIILY